jgi:hypothetical protein
MIREYTYRRTDLWEGFMKYVVEMGSCVMIYISSFIKTGSGIQKLLEGGGWVIHRHTDSVVTSYAYFNCLKIMQMDPIVMW